MFDYILPTSPHLSNLTSFDPTWNRHQNVVLWPYTRSTRGQIWATTVLWLSQCSTLFGWWNSSQGIFEFLSGLQEWRWKSMIHTAILWWHVAPGCRSMSMTLTSKMLFPVFHSPPPQQLLKYYCCTTLPLTPCGKPPPIICIIRLLLQSTSFLSIS